MALVSLLNINISRAGEDIDDFENIMPYLSRIEFRGNDVLFNDAYSIAHGDWKSWSGPDISDKTKRGKIESNTFCDAADTGTAQNDMLQRDRTILLCDEDTVWFSTESYCSEGEDDQGALFSYNRSTHVTTEHEGVFPKCESAVAATRMGNELWLPLTRPGEWGNYSGSGILRYDLKTHEHHIYQPEHLTADIFSEIAYNDSTKALWLTTRRGIDIYYPATDSWEHLFFSPEITDDNRIVIRLDEKPPSVGWLQMISTIHRYGIRDKRGFSRVWTAVDSEWKDSLRHRDHRLLPFYIDALDNTDDDFQFNILLMAITSFDGDEANKLVHETLSRYLNLESLSIKKHDAIIRYGEKYHIDNYQQSRLRLFSRLKAGYIDDPASRNTLCDFAFNNHDLMPELTTFLMTTDVDRRDTGEFLENCVLPRSRWNGARYFEPFVLKALSSNHPDVLIVACNTVQDYADDGVALLESIQQLTSALDRFSRRVTYRDHIDQSGQEMICSTTNSAVPATCKNALFNKINSNKGISALLSIAEGQPHMNKYAGEILTDVTGKNYSSPAEWRSWWQENQHTFTRAPRDRSLDHPSHLRYESSCRPVSN